MGLGFWIKRFLVVLAGSFAIICAAQLWKGHDVVYATSQAAIWSILAALVFTVSRYFQARRGQHCAICKDTPQMHQAADIRADLTRPNATDDVLPFERKPSAGE